MAGIKISQLLEVEEVEPGDYFPVARGGLETYKTPATQFVKSGTNIGAGTGQLYAGVSEDEPPSILFRTLSASGEGMTISNVGNTVVINSVSQTPSVTRRTGDGTTRLFSVIGATSKVSTNYRVDVDGVLQEPESDYRVNPTTLQIEFLKQAPPINSKIVIVSNNLVTTLEADFNTPVFDNTLQYTITIGDHAKNICMSNGSGNVVLVPPIITIPGFTVNIIQTGVGQTQVTPGVGVIINSAGNRFRLAQRYATATLTYIDSTTGWVLYGNLIV
jgi:hypothetical protein